MNKKAGKILIATILVAIVLISGFSVLSQGATVSPKQSSSGTLYIALQQDMPNYNYFNLPSNTVWKADIIGWGWDSLYIMDYSGAMVPYLAQNATFNATSLTLTVTIRQGVYFVWPINGTPAYELTAKDVVFSYFAERFGTTVSGTAFTVPFDDQNYGYVTYQEMLRHVKFINNWTVQFTMCRPYAMFFLDTMSMPIIPWEIWQNHLVTTGNPYDNNSAPFVNPNGSTNGVVDTSWTQSPLATMGTSIFYYAGGLRNSYEIIKLNTNFWGKNWVSPSGYHVYPANISEIYFKIYTTLDTAVLALETGDVDYIAWSIPGSYVPSLSQDPQINIFKSPDDGYFYLAFNMAQQPMNDIHFRQAISHLIDKNTIVEDYMSGIGQAGDSTEPPFFTAWYNSSVVRYAYDPANASAILNASGYVMGPNGWRLLPNGQPMPPITILTPPADYDPIRVKIGEALATEMRAIGIDAQAKAINFDALVAQMSAYQYQMLTLGWSLSTDPLGNLADIYGINAPENYEAFWPSNYTNPNFPTVVSLADPTSSALAWQFQNVINAAQTSFNTNTQIYYAKYAQGILSEAVPVNVLYYEINVEATLNVWSGWFSWEGSIYNVYSLASLHPSAVSTGVGSTTTTHQTVGKIVFPPTSQYLVAQVINPGKVFINQPAFNVAPSVSNVPVSVLVTNNFGLPVPQASVTITASGAGGVSIGNPSGFTNSAGIFTTYVTGTSPGYVNLTASVSYNGMTTSAKSIIESVQFVPNILYMNAIASMPSIMPGQSTNITVQVMDEYGNPVADANVSVATNLLGYGSISPSYVMTNSTGFATFVFTAPSKTEMATTYINQNLESKIFLSASKPGYTMGNTESLIVMTYNPNPSSWIQVHVIGATNWFVNQTNLKTTVEIQATNAQNMPLPNVELKVSASNESYINSSTQPYVITGPNGYANATIVFNSNLKTAGVEIKFFNSTYVNSTSDALTIAYVNGAVPSNLFGGYISFYDGVTGARTNFVSYAGGSVGDQVVVHLFNANNQPTNGSIPVGLVFTAAPEGALLGFYDPSWSSPIDYYFNSLWEFEGININTTYMGFLPPVSGVFVSQLDNQIADPTLGSWLGTSALTAYQYVYYGYGINVNDSYVVNGTGSYYVTGLMSPLLDRISNVYVIPYSYTYYPQTPGIYPPGVIISAGDFYTQGSEYIASQLAIQRAPDIRITTFQVNNPFAFSGGYINATATLLNASDMPVANQSVWFYSQGLVPNPGFINLFYGPAPAWNFTTNSMGVATVTLPVAIVTAPSINDMYVVWNLQPGIPKPGAANVWGIAAITENTQIISIPYQATVMATATEYTVPYQSTSIMNVNVLDSYGQPISGATLSVSASTGNITGSSHSNAAGTGTFYVTPVSNMVTGNPYTVDVIRIKASGPDFLAGTFTLAIIAYSSQPQIAITNLMPAQVLSSSTYTLNGTIWDPSGIKTVTIYVDSPNNSYAVTPVEVANGEYSWSVQVGSFFNGLNAVFVTATNNNNVTVMLPQFFYYQPPVSYVTTTQFNSTVSSLNTSLTSTNTTLSHSLSNYFSNSAGYTSMVLGILALIIALVALALAARKPKKPEVKETPEEKSEQGGEKTS